MYFVTSYLELAIDSVTLNHPFGDRPMPPEVLKVKGLRFHNEANGIDTVALTAAFQINVDDADAIEDVIESLPECVDWAVDAIEGVSEPPGRSFSDFCEEKLEDILVEEANEEDNGDDE